MATNNVRFLAGEQAVFDNLLQNNQLDSNAFYYVRGEGDNTSLYLGYMRLSNTPEINAAIARITTNETDISAIKDKLLELTGGESGETGSIDEKIAAAIKPVSDAVGTIADLTTTGTNLVGAVNELKTAIETNAIAATVAIETDSTTEGALKSYTVKQGNTTLGVIDIPKDLVVKSGEVVVDPPTLDPGTYIKLVIANQEDTPLFINVGTLVDIYSAEQDPAQIQVSVNQTTRKIGATILAGAVDTTELADNAVTTIKIADNVVTTAKINDDAITADKIADNAVTTTAIADKAVTGDKIADSTIGLANLSDEVKTSLGAADSAIKDIVSGTANGTIGKVVADPDNPGSDKTVDVPVKGLQSAAFVDVNAFVSATEYTTNKTTTDKAIQDNADAIAAIVGGSLTWINFDETTPNPELPININE